MARNIRNGRARGAAGISTSRHKSRAKTRRKAANRHDLRAVVGVGASAGGLEAFSAVLENLPVATGMTIVFVSHLDPKHESILTSLLARMTPMSVVEAKHGMALQRNHVYVIPRNARMQTPSTA